MDLLTILLFCRSAYAGNHDMNQRLVISPSGRLLIQQVAGETATQAKATEQHTLTELKTCFAESDAAGLVCLAGDSFDNALTPELLFWQGFAEQFFRSVSKHGEAELQRLVKSKAKANEALAPPSTDVLTDLVDQAPPMRGLEYLTPSLLREQWTGLSQHVINGIGQHPDGPLAYLHEINPAWNTLGRVTFHLAENKADEERPFAFMATYVRGPSGSAGGAATKHLGLGDALKHYAGKRNQAQLNALLHPVQLAADQSDVVRELLESGRLFQPHAVTIQHAHRVLNAIPEMERAGLSVRVPDWWKTRSNTSPEVQVKIGQKKDSQIGVDGLLDFSVDLAIDDQPLTDKERAEILESTAGLMLLRGKWVEVNQTKLQQALEHWEGLQQEYAGGIDFIRGMRMLAGASIDSTAGDQEAAGWTRITTGDWLRETLATLRDPAGDVGCAPGRDLNATLRPYQEHGVRWLWMMTQLGLGACLADDMGLGKTIQVIDLLLALRRQDQSKKSNSKLKSEKASSATTSLLIVPASLIGNWKQEFEKFSPSLKTFYAHRSETDAAELTAVGADPAKQLRGIDVVVTTYGLARRQDWLSNFQWRLVVLDEAQAIKNGSSAQARAVRKIPARGRIALSGTPIENHLGELWSLFDFCCPGLLGNAAQFKRYIKKAEKSGGTSDYSSLRKLVRPYVLRRLKTDPGIAPDLPEKTEMRTECGLSKTQIVLYEKTLKDLEKRLDVAEGIQRNGLVLTTLMQLKQICNHSSQATGDTEFSPKNSGKFQRLKQICQPIIQRQERMLVFTQFRGMTDPLAAFLEQVFGRPGLVLHGGAAVKKRNQLVKQFQAADGPPFFVVSVKAGGTGLNLTEASHVVHFDRWWNPAVENQATDRAFRIGQTRNVLVHKFVCRGTVEERIDEMIRDKQSLADEILSDGAERTLTQMSDSELLDFVAIDLQRASAET